MPNLALIIAQYAYRVESIYTRSYSLLKYTHSLSAQGLRINSIMIFGLTLHELKTYGCETE